MKVPFISIVFALCCLNGFSQVATTDFADMANMPTQQLMDVAKAKFLSEEPRYDQALLAYTIVTNRYSTRMSKREKESCAAAFNNIGYIYFFHYYDYAKAYSYFTKSLEISKEINYIKNFPPVYINIGNMYAVTASLYDSENLAIRSLDSYKKAFHASIKTEAWNDMITSFSNMASIALALDKIDDINNELQIFNHQPLPDSVEMRSYAKAFYNSIVDFQSGNYEKSLQELDNAIRAIDTKMTPERFHCSLLSSKNYILVKLKHYGEAERTLKEKQAIIDRFNIIDLNVENMKMISDLYKEMGNESLSENYYYRYLERKDSIMTQNNLQRVSEMQFLDEIHQVDNQLKDVSAKKRQLTMFLWFVAIIALLFFIFAIILYRKNKELDFRNRILYERTQEMLQKEETFNQKMPMKQQNSFLKDEDKRELIKDIEFVFNNIDEICSTEFSLNRLAQLVNSKPRYVSQAINETLNMTFTNMLTDARIKEACKRLNDIEQYGHLTIEAIAQSVGFKSRSNFVNNFKRLIGITPSEYQKLAKKMV